MDVRLRTDLTRKDLAMGVFEANGNISKNRDNSQKDKLKNARDEMQETLMKVMAKIFSAKVVIERLPDIHRREKQIDNEKNPELDDDKENVLKDCKVSDAPMCLNCMSFDCSGCNHVDNSCTDTTEIVDKCFSADRHENESNTLDANKSNRQSFLQYYHKYCPDCSEIQSSEKRIPKCKNCNLQWNYECKKCSKQLPTYKGIINHLITKCIEKGHYFSCFKCDYTSIHKFRVNLHLKKAHSIVNSLDRIAKIKNENFQNDMPTALPVNYCTKCGRPFDKLPHLLRHLQLCGKTKYNAHSKKLSNGTLDKCVHHCVKCNQTVKNHKVRGFYGKKCQSCRSKFSFKCKQCNQIFHSYNTIHLHLKIHHKVHSKDAFKCPECDYKTSLVEYLSRHVKRMHANEIHVCPKCGGKYNTRIAYKDHIRYCTKELEFQCDYCSHKCKTKAHVKRHIFQVHTDGNEIDCPQCGTTLKNKYSFSLHQTYCQTTSLHQCDKCPFKTKYKIESARHQIRMHSDVQKK